MTVPAPRWRCAWCLDWNRARDVACLTCGRDLELWAGNTWSRFPR